MRADLERLLDDITLVTIALAIAVGYSLFQLAKGVATTIDGLTTHLPPETGGFSFSGSGLTWTVGHHIVTFDALLTGLIELGVSLAAAVLVARRSGA